MLSVSSRFLGAALAGCLVLCGPSVDAQPKVQQILLLHGSDRGNLVLDSFTGKFRVDLDDRSRRTVNVVQIVIGPTGLVGAPEQAVVDYIQSTFADRPKPDLILTVAGPAAVFARRYRQQLFPDTPLLFACRRPAIPSRRAAGREGKGRRGRQRLSPTRRRHPAAASPDEAGVRGDGVRTDRTILASRAREPGSALSPTVDVRLVRQPVASGNIASLLEPSARLGHLLYLLRSGRAGWGVCGRAGARRPSRQCECAHVRLA